jgi:hypothetical protein
MSDTSSIVPVDSHVCLVRFDFGCSTEDVFAFDNDRLSVHGIDITIQDRQIRIDGATLVLKRLSDKDGILHILVCDEYWARFFRAEQAKLETDDLSVLDYIVKGLGFNSLNLPSRPGLPAMN